MIVFDVETTGTDSRKHSLVSIGAIDVLAPERRFYEECQIFPDAHIDPEALHINGFSESEIRDPNKKTDVELVREFIDWVMQSEDHTLAAHHPMFDVGFLQAAAWRGHLDFPLARRTLDLHTIGYMHMVKAGIKPPQDKHRSALNSDAIHKYTGIGEEPKPHRAINGALFEAESLSRLLFDTKLLIEFNDKPILWQKL